MTKDTKDSKNVEVGEMNGVEKVSEQYIPTAADNPLLKNDLRNEPLRQGAEQLVQESQLQRDEIVAAENEADGDFEKDPDHPSKAPKK